MAFVDLGKYVVEEVIGLAVMKHRFDLLRGMCI